MFGIIDPIMVDQECIDNGTEFQQTMPFMAIAGQTGGLGSEDRPDLPLTDRGHQGFEALTFDMPTTRAA